MGKRSFSRRKYSSAHLGRRLVGGGRGKGAVHHRSRGYHYTRPQTFETKLRTVKLYLEEGLPSELVAHECGISRCCLFEWIRQYRLYGEAGLKPKPRGHRRVNTASAVKFKITAIKKNNPTFGVKRISQTLRRLFMLPASPETVRRTLHKAGLISPRRRKPRRNPPKPRFFERSTPNQLWQSDIFCFRLGGENAYLIGFIDDYSRYITALGVYRGQTADNVLEVYRRARGEYGAPKEMLTDNGRQYTCWRGKTKFEQEMQRDRIHHFRSQPHHPMTLGKIERFWKTIWVEFLEMAKFESFESAQERIAYWIKYYNHRRPHQGIAGMCPADRFFEIRKEIKEVLEKGIETNVQELALRGKPAEQFYMVGRMGEKSVVIRAERGQVKMQVEGDDEKLIGGIGNDYDTGEDGEEAEGSVQRAGEGTGSTLSMEREAEASGGVQEPGDSVGTAEQLGEKRPRRDIEVTRHGEAAVGNGGSVAGDPPGETAGRAGEDRAEGGIGNHEEIHRDGEMPGSTERMGGKAETFGNSEGTGDRQRAAVAMAGGRDGWYAPCPGAEVAGGGKLSDAVGESEETAGTESVGERRAAAETGKTAGTACGVGEGAIRELGGTDGRETMGGEDRPGAEWPAYGDGSGQAAGGEPEDVLQAGEPCAVRAYGWTQGS